MLSCGWSLFLLFFGFLEISGSSDENPTYERCQTPEGSYSTCVNVTQCKPIIDLLRVRVTPAQRGRLLKYICGRGKVCCPEPYHEREIPPDVTNHTNLYLLPENCGRWDSADRISHGEDAGMNEYPWMVLLQYNRSGILEFHCSGTIINYNYILTAGHCLTSKYGEPVSVRVGEYSIRNKTDCQVEDVFRNTIKCNPPVQDLKVEEVISHNQYMEVSKNPFNDIALLRVSRISAEINAYPVCLPVGRFRDKPLFNGYVAGWGIIDPKTKETADILQKVGLPISDRGNCEAIYRRHEMNLTKTQICAGGRDGKASCPGDSGGPLQVVKAVDGSFIFVQYGIISFGPEYCTIDYPSVFTLVKFYMDWILDNMKP